MQELHFEFSRQKSNGNVLIRNLHVVLGSRSERGGARRAPTKRVIIIPTSPTTIFHYVLGFVAQVLKKAKNRIALIDLKATITNKATPPFS